LQLIGHRISHAKNAAPTAAPTRPKEARAKCFRAPLDWVAKAAEPLLVPVLLAVAAEPDKGVPLLAAALVELGWLGFGATVAAAA